MEEWRPIYDFHGYEVSDQGRVLNARSGRILAQTENQRELLMVGLMRGGIQHKRTVSHLVAKAYLLSAEHEAFDSVINLDGDRYNNYARNLMWRPKWFAMRYNFQFRSYVHGYGSTIMDVDSEEKFDNAWDAVIKYGLLVAEVVESVEHQTYVWPTKQRFCRLD
jgi:hypothetical protein